jgi:hypothetical protein
MHALSRMFLGASGLALAAISQADAATLITVTPPSGAVGTTVFGINKHGVIAGSYVDASGVEHGFFGPLNGTYTTFDFGGTSIGTEPRALDDDGVLTGFAADPNFAVGTEFLRQTDGTLLTFEKDGTPLDGVAQGVIKKKTTSTGDYIDPATGIRTGYLGRDGSYETDVTLGLNVTRTSPRSLNHFGTLAGFYVDPSGLEHGFILKHSNVQTIDADSSGTTALEGINKKELVTGQVTDSSGNPHSFVYNNATGEFTTIVINDGSVLQQAWGINDFGQIAVSTDVASYIYCLRDAQCPRGGTTVADGHSWKGNAHNGVKPAKSAHATRGAVQ